MCIFGCDVNSSSFLKKKSESIYLKRTVKEKQIELEIFISLLTDILYTQKNISRQERIPRPNVGHLGDHGTSEQVSILLWSCFILVNSADYSARFPGIKIFSLQCDFSTAGKKRVTVFIPAAPAGIVSCDCSPSSASSSAQTTCSHARGELELFPPTAQFLQSHCFLECFKCQLLLHWKLVCFMPQIT